MSSSSNQAAKKVTRSTDPSKMSLTVPPTIAKPSSSHSAPVKLSRPLRETTLKKAASVARSSITEDPKPSNKEMSPEEKVAAWPQIDSPVSIRIEAASDDDFSSIASEAGRPSFIRTTTRKSGIEMDLATKVANDMFQAGKEALETAGNMKRENKATALDSLQSLYETVLSLSDSRARHKLNLEKERSRHAQELVRVERAHTRKMTVIQDHLSKELSQAHSGIKDNLQESKAIRKWLGFETQDPYRTIAATQMLVKRIEEKMEKLPEVLSRHTMPNAGAQEDQERHNMYMKRSENLSRQLDEHRREIAGLVELSRSVVTSTEKTLEILESRPASPPQEQKESEYWAEVQQEIQNMNKNITQLTVPPPAANINMKEHLGPITERLEAVSSEIKTMRELRQKTPPPAMSLGAELAIAEMAKAMKPPQTTYAEKLKSKPPPRPNHTLIVSSTDPQHTGEHVLTAIKSALDTKTTGARVDRVRRARNQKVVLSCGSKEELETVRNRVKASTHLTAEIPKTKNPLIRIRDVLSYHKDDDIVEHLRKQNPQVFQDIKLSDSTIRVRFRKRARNHPLECHPILEVSPVLHRRLIEVGKVYIDLQRRPVEDQSPLVQCAKCLGFGHTKALCREKDENCSYCGGVHSWDKCLSRKGGKPPSCINCHKAKLEGTIPHSAFSAECPERGKWDGIARSRVTYC